MSKLGNRSNIDILLDKKKEYEIGLVVTQLYIDLDSMKTEDDLNNFKNNLNVSIEKYNFTKTEIKYLILSLGQYCIQYNVPESTIISNNLVNYFCKLQSEYSE